MYFFYSDSCLVFVLQHAPTEQPHKRSNQNCHHCIHTLHFSLPKTHTHFTLSFSSSKLKALGWLNFNASILHHHVLCVAAFDCVCLPMIVSQWFRAYLFIISLIWLFNSFFFLVVFVIQVRFFFLVLFTKFSKAIGLSYIGLYML